jgi:hypothetical protein
MRRRRGRGLEDEEAAVYIAVIEHLGFSGVVWLVHCLWARPLSSVQTPKRAHPNDLVLGPFGDSFWSLSLFRWHDVWILAQEVMFVDDV